MPDYHPIDVRYKGPSTAYRGSAKARASKRPDSHKADVAKVRRTSKGRSLDGRVKKRTFRSILSSKSMSAVRWGFWLYRVFAFIRAWAILLFIAVILVYAFYIDIVTTFWP
jgi:hypothetical protein